MSCCKVITSAGNGIGNGSRQVRDGVETPSMTLRLFLEEFCRLIFFEHVQNFHETCEEIANHCDCLKTALRHSRECMPL